MNFLRKKIKKLGSFCTPRQYVRYIFTPTNRRLYGFTENLLLQCEVYDPKMFEKYLHITPEIFYELLNLIKNDITKEYVVREPISPKTRLQIFLTCMAQGTSMSFLSGVFRVAPSTISGIIEEVSEAIWKNLKPLVFMEPSKENWLQIAEDFEKIWNFPHCVGAIDGRHMEMQV